MAYLVMACIVMVYTIMVYIAMVYTVVAYMVVSLCKTSDDTPVCGHPYEHVRDSTRRV